MFTKKLALLLQVSDKAVFILFCNIIRKTQNSQRVIEKEIILLMPRDTDPKQIHAIVKYNPNLLLTPKESLKIFMLATTSKSNAINCGKS